MGSRIQYGDVFSIATKLGFSFLQFVEKEASGIQYVRVIDYISMENTITQTEINKKERWFVGFLVQIAAHRKIIHKIGSFEVPEDFSIPKFARTEHNIRGQFLGWHIVNRTTLMRELKRELSEEDIKLSPYGCWNDTLIIEKIESNWKLEEWK